MRSYRSTAILVAAAIVLSGLTACTSTSSAEPASGVAATATDVAPDASGSTQLTTAAEQSSSPTGCRPPSLANCYTDATMLGYIQKVQPMIDKFFRARYQQMPPPRNYFFVADGQTMDSACTGPDGNSTMDSMSYAYCPADDDVYLGQAQMWKLYNNDGDAAPAIGLAHEWGHNIQNQAHVPEPQTSEESVNHEDQADCVAGAWVQYAIQQGWFENEDVSSTERLIVDIASAEEPDRTHGDLAERSDSIALGIQGGLTACNSFYPDTPIYTS